MEKWIRIMDIAFLRVTPVLSTFPAMIVCYSKYFTTDLGGKAFELPVPIWQRLPIFEKLTFSRTVSIIHRLPFDAQTPAGFLGGIFIQYVLAFNAMVNLKCLAIFAFGTSSMLFPLTEDIKRNLKRINGNAKRNRNQCKVVKQLSTVMQFHSKSMQLCHLHLPVSLFKQHNPMVQNFISD